MFEPVQIVSLQVEIPPFPIVLDKAEAFALTLQNRALRALIFRV